MAHQYISGASWLARAFASGDPSAHAAFRACVGRRTLIADTRQRVATLNGAIRDQRLVTGETKAAGTVSTAARGTGRRRRPDRHRRNDQDLGVANRDSWTVTAAQGDLAPRGPRPPQQPGHRYADAAPTPTDCYARSWVIPCATARSPPTPCHVRGADNSRRVDKIRPASLAELEVLTAAMPERYRPMVSLAAWCGLRLGELTERPADP